MSSRSRIWFRAMIVAAVLYAASPAYATIDYTVSLSHPERHIFGVTMRIPNVRDQVTVQMPAWNALYQIRDFSSHIMQVTAKDEEGHPLPLRKLDKESDPRTVHESEIGQVEDDVLRLDLRERPPQLFDIR